MRILLAGLVAVVSSCSIAGELPQAFFCRHVPKFEAGVGGECHQWRVPGHGDIAGARFEPFQNLSARYLLAQYLTP